MAEVLYNRALCKSKLNDPNGAYQDLIQAQSVKALGEHDKIDEALRTQVIICLLFILLLWFLALAIVFSFLFFFLSSALLFVFASSVPFLHPTILVLTHIFRNTERPSVSPSWSSPLQNRSSKTQERWII